MFLLYLYVFAKIKNTVKQTAIYSLGNLSTKLIGLILLPIYTEYLTTDQYGTLALFEITSQILISLFSVNLTTAMIRWCALERDELKERSIVFTAFFTTFIISSLLSVTLIPFSEQFSILFFQSPDFINYFTILFLSSSLGLINLIPLSLLRLREKALFFSVINTLKFIVILVLNIYFIVILQMGVEGIILSQLIGQLLLFIISAPFLIKNITFSLNIQILMEMIKYGVPLIFSNLFGLILINGDRYIIKYLLGDSSVGIYALGHKIASVINVFVLQSFQLSFLPLAFKKASDPDAKRFFSKILTYYVYILLIFVLGLSLFSEELIKVLSANKDYWASYYVIPVIAFSFVFRGMYQVFVLGFHITKKTHSIALILFVCAVMNILLNIALIPSLDIWGSAIALLISFGFAAILANKFSKNVYPIPFETAKILKMLIVAITLFGASLLTAELNLFFRILVKVILLPIFPFVLYKMNFYEEIELERIKETLNKILRRS